MKTYAPDYYNEFKCIADKCKNSCCIGWEIDIDDNTYKKYMSLNSPIGEKLRKNITEELPHSFKLKEDEKCPFLNENGLCELILTLGEASLCSICELHPRFRNFYNTRTEIGLGLCCEAVCALVLNKKTPTKLIIIDEDSEKTEEDATETEMIEIRDNILSLITNRESTLEKRKETLLDLLEIPELSLSLPMYENVFASLEYMDKNSKNKFSNLKDEKSITELESEQLLFYFVYRYAANSFDVTEMRAYVAFALLSEKVISALSRIIPKEEACRLYSSEIEYNEENVEKLLDRIYEIIGD